jgi:lipopolysaccharide export system ATP-binding protein
LFEGDVRISSPVGVIESERATIRFADHRLLRATAEGAPARFSRTMPEPEPRRVTGTANRIDYDLGRGELELSGQAALRDGVREVSGGRLVYRIAEDRLLASADEEGTDRVRIVITPPGEDNGGDDRPDGGDGDDDSPEDAVRTLQAEGISKSYRSRRVVHDLSLSISSGEVVGLLGPNGAGKTTAFYMIVGLVPCDSGRILLDEADLTALPMHRRARLGVGYLPQEASVFRGLTVEDNILAVLETRKELDTLGRRQQLEELLEELNIGHIRDSKGLSLSGGERRRVEIARALAAEPAFILLDEPFAGVDPISVLDIQRIIGHLRDRGIGVLITDHNVRETLGICGRAFILNAGEVIASGTADEILANRQVREVYLGEHFRL